MKIGITGAHGVGKSTTLRDFIGLSHFNIPILTEVAREVINGGGDQGTISFQREVTHKQVKRENKLGSFISDRVVIDNLAYAREMSEDLYQELKKVCDKQWYDLVFLIPIQFDIEDDGVRPIEKEFQLAIHNQIVRILKETGTKFIVLDGDRRERVSKMMKAINFLSQNLL